MTTKGLTITDKYRAVFFGSDMGKEVLGDILSSCHFLESLSNEASMDEHNVGTLILNKCGVTGTGTLPQLINAFVNIVPNQKSEDV